LAGSLDLSGSNVRDALEKLQILGAVEARRVGETDYYAYKRDLPPLH
jgi:hypothetical protein